MPPQETHNRHMSLIIVVVLVVLVGLAFVWYKQNGSGMQAGQKDNKPLTPAQTVEVLSTLQPPKAASTTMTAAQKKALDSLGSTGTAKQSSNPPAKEQSILDSLTQH